MAKQNAMLAKRDAKIYAEYRKQLDIAFQMGMDAAMIAANKVLQLGKGRAEEFGLEYMNAMRELANLINADSKDDKEIVYAREKHDQKIKAIVGEDNFEPWDVRYSASNRYKNRKGN